MSALGRREGLERWMMYACMHACMDPSYPVEIFPEGRERGAGTPFQSSYSRDKRSLWGSWGEDITSHIPPLHADRTVPFGMCSPHDTYLISIITSTININGRVLRVTSTPTHTNYIGYILFNSLALKTYYDMYI